MPEYIVTGRSNGTTRLGSPYCNLKVKNLDEEFTLAVWEIAPDDPPLVGQLVTFINIQNNDGKRSARTVTLSMPSCRAPYSASSGTRPSPHSSPSVPTAPTAI